MNGFDSVLSTTPKSVIDSAQLRHEVCQSPMVDSPAIKKLRLNYEDENKQKAHATLELMY